MEQIRFSISLSQAAYDWLKIKAASNNRSLSKEVKTILEEAQKSEMEDHAQETKAA